MTRDGPEKEKHVLLDGTPSSIQRKVENLLAIASNASRLGEN